MALKEILIYPDPVLREPAEPISNIDGKVQILTRILPSKDGGILVFSLFF